MQAVDINTGEVVVFDESVREEERVDAVVASASIPGVFPAIDVGGKVLVDGGLYTDLDMNEAVLKCREFGF